MIQKTLTSFDLKQIADSGQSFRMAKLQDRRFSVISGEHYLEIVQGPGEDHAAERSFTFCCDEEELHFCEPEELPFWERYFDLDTDYDAFRKAINPRDAYLKQAADFGQGVRILRQDLWEMIITFIISQQQTIPSIRRRVEDLSHAYGSRLPVPGTFYSFPSPEQLSAASLEDLLAMKLGYRAKYIKRACEDACSGRLDLSYLGSLSYEDAMDYLTGFYGIGEKVANCICLFGLHHIDAFPVDTWIRKILMNRYAPKSRLPKDLPQSRVCEALIQKHFSRYRGFAGVMQQYIFYYERNAGNSSG